MQSVAKEAIQASRQAQEVPNRLPRQENNIQFLRKNIEDNASQLESLLTEEQRKRAEAEQNAAAALQRAETLEEGIRQRDIQLQEVTKSLQAVEEEKNGLRERKEAAQSRIGTLETELQSVQQQRDDVTRQLQEILQRLHETEQQFRDTSQQLHDTSQQLRDSEQRLHDTSQQLHDSEQRLHDTSQQLRGSEQRHWETEQRLQEAYQRADQQQERATTSETRLQHSDQMFQDILQRLIGQLPQSQPHWVVRRDEIELLDEELGSGGWATVRVARFRGNRVAAKCLHRQIVSAHNVRLFTREMNMAANARHPNLLQFIGATLDNQEPIIVTELMPTSLRRVMEEGTRLTHPQIVSVARQVALALNYLHLTQPEAIIHRDVSSSNVLLEPLQSSWKAKLSDYGSANFVRHTTTAGPGNPTYAAPEANNPEQHSAKMDVFSFGVLLVEMCSGELAPEEHRDRLLAAIQWPAMVGLIQQCLKYEPHRRPDMSGVITQLEQV